MLISTAHSLVITNEESKLKVVRTEKAPLPVGPYSQGIKAGNLLFVSGQGPLDPKIKKTVGLDIESQTKQTLENVKAILAAAGMTLESVVKVSVFLKDMGDFKKMNDVYSLFFPNNPPARTTVQAQLAMSDWFIEIDVIACSG
jgi:2-iminobutanoate/2-iminopropanoate deaminase